MNDEEVVLLLGSDRGEQRDLVSDALVLLDRQVGELVRNSCGYWSAPWGFEDEQPFLNMAVVLLARLDPSEMLAQCLAIEQHFGRERDASQLYTPRTLDIDILYFGDQVIDLPDLSVPHPRLAERPFALIPLHEVSPGMRHPVLGLTASEMLSRLS